MFREQHRQMIEEQKRLLDDYKLYFDGVLKEMEERDRKAAPPIMPPKSEQQVTDLQEIAEIGALLDEAVTTYGKELAEILTELTERQRKRAEATLTPQSEKDGQIS
jgi:hypothetical protein